MLPPHPRPPGPLDVMGHPIHVGDVIVWASKLTSSTDAVTLYKGLVEGIRDPESPLPRLMVRKMSNNDVLDRETVVLMNLHGIALTRCWHRLAGWKADSYTWAEGHEPILVNHTGPAR